MKNRQIMKEYTMMAILKMNMVDDLNEGNQLVHDNTLKALDLMNIILEEIDNK